MADLSSGKKPAMGESRRRESRGHLSSRQTMHIMFVAWNHLHLHLVLETSRDRGHDQSEFRWRIHYSLHSQTRLRRRSRFKFARRAQGVGRNGESPETRDGCMLHRRWTTRPAARREDGSGIAGQENGCRHFLLSYFSPAQDSTQQLGPATNPAPIFSCLDSESSSHLCSKERGRSPTERKTPGNADGDGRNA